MTVEASDTIERQVVSGVGPYPFSFRIFNDTDLAVTVCSSASPSVPWLLTHETHYTVSGANDSDGGSVTLTTEIATAYAGYTLDVRSNTPATQPTSIRNAGRFLPEIHEDAYDRLTRKIQDLERRLEQCVRLPDNVTTSAEMTPLSNWVSKYLAVSSSGALEPALLSSTAVSQSILAGLLFPQTSAELAAGITPVNLAIPSHDACGEVRATRYGLVSDNAASDQTTRLNNAYAVAKEAECDLRLPPGRFRFTSALLWDGTVSVFGASRRGTSLVKDISGGDFVAITITSGGRGCEFCYFNVTTTTGTGGTPPTPGVGHGIQIGEDTNINLHDVDVFYQSGNGLYPYAASGSTGNFNQYRNLGLLYNGIDGSRIVNHSSSRWDNINCFGNVGWGFNIPNTGSNSSFHTGNITCQGNGLGGTNIASQNNVLQIYGEGNTGPDLVLTADAYQNHLVIYHTDGAADIQDLGVDKRNVIICVSAAGLSYISTEYVTRPARQTNIVGENVYIVGGTAGAGASAREGGLVGLIGGNSAGTGNASGGIAKVQGGTGVGTGAVGTVQLQPDGGGIVVGANANPSNASISIEFRGTTQVILLPKLTSTQRDALTAVDGMLLYNTTTAKLQGRAASAWVDLN